MKRNIDPRRLILGMMARACPECQHVQHVYFKSNEEYDKWECPECRERKDNENVQLQQSVGGEVQDPSGGEPLH